MLLAYVRLVLGLAAFYFISSQAGTLLLFLRRSSEGEILMILFTVAFIFILSFVIFYLSIGTSLPSFVIAILFGIATQKLLNPIVHNHTILGTVVGFSATLILFGGGLETPWGNFKKLILKILTLSFVGLFITAALFSLSLGLFAKLLGADIPIHVSILLGALLASTDPAAIIPVLKKLRFVNRDTKDLIISESAMTDVTGTLLTTVFLSLIASGIAFTDILDGYAALFTVETGAILLKQIAYGILLGVIGYAGLEYFTQFKKKHAREFEADLAYFLFVPIVIFAITLAFGGSGYLAAFLAGLLFMLTESLHETERFFNQTIDGFLKPTIFLLLGALVDVQSIIAYAPIGLLASLVFMLVIRPIAVFLSLGPFSFFKRNKNWWKELLFISFVRETGAIPAVLLVTIVTLGIPGVDVLVPIGMWVILATLILEPPLTPLLARYLHIAVTIEDNDALHINGTSDPFVILASRGHSYIERLPIVTEWAEKHVIKRVVLLHCLEDNYTAELAKEIGIEAEAEFAKIHKERELRGRPQLQFLYISRQGFLQQNIDDLSKTHNNITTIFVGSKVLDYRLDEVKKLHVPLFFLD